MAINQLNSSIDIISSRSYMDDGITPLYIQDVASNCLDTPKKEEKKKVILLLVLMEYKEKNKRKLFTKSKCQRLIF